MKLVSFEIANKLKEVGYPQDIWKYSWFYSEDGELLNISNTGYYEIPAPYVMEVWLWLCRERHSCLSIIYDSEIHKWYIDEFRWKREYFSDPEEAIKSAIEYLCDNDLIK